MSVDLDRALTDSAYRESVVGLSDPVVELLKRAGAFARPLEDSRPIWSPYGEDLGTEMYTIREVIPLDPTLPFEALRPLLASGFGRAVVALHPSTPVSTLFDLAADEVEAVQEAVLKNASIGVAELERLSCSPFQKIRWNVTFHPRLTREMAEVLVNTDPDQWVRARALAKSQPDVNELARLAERNLETAVGNEIAEHAKVTPEILSLLAGSDYRPTTLAVARNPRTPAEAIERIANQARDRELRELVMLHPNAPQQWILDLMITSPEHRSTLVKRKELSPDAQRICASDLDKTVRVEIARKGTDAQALAMLADDPFWQVRSELAKNRNCPVEILKVLAEDPRSTFTANDAKQTLASLGHT